MTAGPGPGPAPTPTAADARSRLAAMTPEQRAQLADELRRRRGEPRPRGTGLRAHDWPETGASAPATPQQRRIWLEQQLAPESTAYVLPALVTIADTVDVDRLAAALHTVSLRHAALRTTVALRADGELEQRVDAAPLRLERRTIRPGDLDDEVATRIAVPFDLAVEAPARAVLFESPGPSGRPGERHLLLTLHHVAVDGWSLGLLVDDVSAAYAGTSRAAPLQYLDHALDRAANPPSPGGAAPTDPLAGAEALPWDSPGGAPRRAVVRHVELPPDLLAALHAVERGGGHTHYVSLAAAVALVIARWSGRDDLVLGMPVANRDSPDREGIVGLFMDNRAVRVRTTSRTVREFLLAVQTVVLGELARDATPAGAPDPTALVRALVSLRNVDVPTLVLGDATCPVRQLPTGQAQVPFLLEVVPRADGGADGWLELETAALGPGLEPDRVAAAIVHTLELLADPATGSVRLADLDVLDAEHARLVTTTFPGIDATGDPGPATVLTAWAARVAHEPDAVVVLDDAAGSEHTVAELERWSRSLAAGLRRHGAGAGTLVGVAVDRGPLLLAVLLAVLRTGAGYVPVDPTLPPARRAQVVTDAAPLLVVGEGPAAASLPVPVVAPGALVDEPSPAGADVEVPPGAADVAYVLYTSGSTGRPKGVAVAHGAIANRVARMVAADGLDRAGERILQKTSTSFDPSLTEMLAGLTGRGTIVVAAPGRHGDPAYLLDVVARRSVTSFDVVPSMLSVLVEHRAFGSALAGVRQLYCGGEELAPDLVARVHAALPHLRLVNLYGPTEAAVDATAQLVEPGAGRVPIGRPIPGTSAWVLDATRRPCPIGVDGEIYLGGRQLAQGYLGRPGLTAAAFVPSPFEVGRRVYATGDRARWAADGTLEFRGRVDDQVKIRGVRVEPGEVESALRRHPLVGDAAVIVSPGPALAAYVTAATVEPPTVEPPTVEPPTDAVPGSPPAGLAESLPARLRTDLARDLPPAMVPDGIVVLDALPVGSSGKVDRAALRALTPSPSPAGDGVAPADDLETVLCSIWSAAIGHEIADVTAEFFEVGGHSLAALRILGQVQELLRIDLTVAEVLTTPTIRSTAAVLRERGAERGVDADAVASVVRRVMSMDAESVAAALRTGA
ncbi:amino acid adenylation domain-containing protein [Jatrophihabitans endophyticus]|uniref:Amino acid adenylation domain-containing protein n=1 Tax=Jatrophihabitans endophyticus TaxID=1206085 RepID=A0A1M5CRB2_9ACTN|nr:non-ribosomal peptide synthetase [Jatrophihabitans endophyticus]SHF57156.1 amino acid adenylation domain-containing protein [Jatrophihabitans endophyticus]